MQAALCVSEYLMYAYETCGLQWIHKGIDVYAAHKECFTILGEYI